MEVYRIVKEKYAVPLSGIGASLVGGRWNSVGIEMIYTSQSRALAILEVLAHLPKTLLPDDLVLLQIKIPESLPITKISKSKLPENWHQFPPLRSTKQKGDQFIKLGKTLLLQVPSALVKDEYNYLINPHHADFKKISIVKIEKFNLDNRLL
jgi:RES domain-containing protein